jgi:hypothetical protein
VGARREQAPASSLDAPGKFVEAQDEEFGFGFLVIRGHGA